MRHLFMLLMLTGSSVLYANTIVHEDNFDNCGAITWTHVADPADSESFDAWSCSSFGGQTFMELYDGDGNNDSDWLVSPSFNLDLYDEEYFSFSYRNSGGFAGLSLYYSTDYNGGGSPADVGSATWTAIPLDLFNVAGSTYVSNFLYQRAIDLSAIAGSSVYFAFKFESTGSTQGWSINDVRLTADYYEDIIAGIQSGDKCYDLKTALHEEIDEHRTIPYTNSEFDVWDALYVTDRRLNDAGTAEIVYDMYSDNPAGAEPYEFTHGDDQDTGTSHPEGVVYNREHVFPRSWWGGTTTLSDTINTDLHHIVPSDRYVNFIKLNFAMADVGTVNTTTMNGCQQGASSVTGYTGDVFEPIDEYKGDFARFYLYIATRYQHNMIAWETENSFGNDAMNGDPYTAYDTWLLTNLLAWHEADPVSQKEIDRNNAVYSIQGNRNPFIDHPEYVFFIWGSSTDLGCPVVLPVELSEFSGKASDYLETELAWTTQAEINSDYFMVQHSTDGRGFLDIGKVSAQGNSSEINSYTFIHDEARQGTNYYRLKIVDLDGSYEFSEWVEVSHGKAKAFKVYPTLVHNQVTIEVPETGMTECLVFDTHGRMMIRQELVQTENTLNLGNLPQGQYLIQLQNGGATEVVRIFVK